MVVVAVAKISIVVVVYCDISVNVSLNADPQISIFAAYARVPELARSSRTPLNEREKWTLNVVHVLSGIYLRFHYLYLREYKPTLKTKV